MKPSPAPPNESVRAFVALPLPDPIKERIAAFQHDLKAHLTSHAFRWANPAQLHLTLEFLGDIPAASLPPVQRALHDAVAGIAPLQLAVSGLGFFPNLRKPRVCWVGLEGDLGRLHLLQENVVHALAAWAPQEEKAFTPHLTLARIKFPDQLVEAAVQDLPETCTDCQLGAWTAEEVHLMRSQLKPQGADYTILASLPLAGALER